MNNKNKISPGFSPLGTNEYGTQPTRGYRGSGVLGTTPTGPTEYPNALYSPFVNTSVQNYKTYNVSPMTDTVSPGIYGSGGGVGGQKSGKNGLMKIMPINAISALGLSDIPDIWIDNLKRVLGKHLYQTLSKLDTIVNNIITQMQQKGLQEHLQAARNLLESNTEKESFSGSMITVNDLLNYIKTNINPQLVLDYKSTESLLLCGKSALEGNTFFRVQNSLKRLKELNKSPDKFIRISWPSGSTPSSSPYNRYDQPAAGESSPLSDADLVISMFFHYCDMKGNSSGSSQKFSSIHYIQDVPSISTIASVTGTPLVGILRQENASINPTSPGLGSPGFALGVSPGTPKNGVLIKPNFSVFMVDGRCIEVLEVEEGRQNCFLSILIFLLESLKIGVQNSHGKKVEAVNISLEHNTKINSQVQSGISLSPVIRDICLEIFNVRDVPGLLDYLYGFGLDY
mmetsp:Transcript_17945/g.17260  ORF Transcript_17945/g.17260 Transcript_17945/m.17260 type:complete len:456 (+) Transcript_17945:749-2116(+)